MQLPKIVAARLQRSSIAEHPDPDLLTAFAEQKLAGRECDSVLEHLAACEECRQILVLAAPESVPQAVPAAFGSSSWLRMPLIRWGAVAASIVIVAAAIVVRRIEPPPRMENTRGATELPAIRAKTNNTPVPGANRVPQQVASANTAAARKPGAAGAAAKAAPPFTPRETTETAASTIDGAARFTDFRSPNWRISKDGLPERSFTSGQWEKVQVDHKRGFRAVAALGMDVWVGGSGGILYHSEDMGLNWTRLVPSAGGSALSDDITALAFADRSHGKLTTAAGQTWVT